MKHDASSQQEIVLVSIDAVCIIGQVIIGLDDTERDLRTQRQFDASPHAGDKGARPIASASQPTSRMARANQSLCKRLKSMSTVRPQLRKTVAHSSQIGDQRQCISGGGSAAGILPTDFRYRGPSMREVPGGGKGAAIQVKAAAVCGLGICAYPMIGQGYISALSCVVGQSLSASRQGTTYLLVQSIAFLYLLMHPWVSWTVPKLWLVYC